MLSIEYVLPKNELLSKHILYYYFLRSDKPEGRINFVHFPHYYETINIYSKSSIEIFDTERVVRYNPKAPITTVLTHNKSSFKQALLVGEYNIVGVIFKPLGISNFIKVPLSEIMPKPEMILGIYGEDLLSKMKSVFREKANIKKVLLLNEFFLEQYCPLNEDKLLNIIAAVMASKGNIKVGEIEQRFSINRRTLLRLFKKHLCCSIMDFKRIVKFRMTLDKYLKSKKDITLTDLSYEMDYYDQSDFISHFKSLAGNVPSKMLNQISRVGEEDIFWQFL